jgi:CRISPR system Cascade subunit CasE
MTDAEPVTLFRTLLRLDAGDAVLHADELHRISMDLFPVDLPEGSPRSEVGVLCRRDGENLLVQSLIPPSRPTRGATILETGPWQVPVDATRMTVRARLSAESNTSSGPAFLPKEARQRSGRRPIPPHQRREWAIKKLSEAGLLFQSPPATSVHELKFSDGARPPIPVVDISGMALVTDMSKFLPVLLGGLGRGKSYGVGLVDVAPV